MHSTSKSTISGSPDSEAWGEATLYSVWSVNWPQRRDRDINVTIEDQMKPLKGKINIVQYTFLPLAVIKWEWSIQVVFMQFWIKNS